MCLGPGRAGGLSLSYLWYCLCGRARGGRHPTRLLIFKNDDFKKRYLEKLLIFLPIINMPLFFYLDFERLSHLPHIAFMPLFNSVMWTSIFPFSFIYSALASTVPFIASLFLLANYDSLNVPLFSSIWPRCQSHYDVDLTHHLGRKKCVSLFWQPLHWLQPPQPHKLKTWRWPRCHRTCRRLRYSPRSSLQCLRVSTNSAFNVNTNFLRWPVISLNFAA